jgi:hypothetical protein
VALQVAGGTQGVVNRLAGHEPGDGSTDEGESRGALAQPRVSRAGQEGAPHQSHSHRSVMIPFNHREIRDGRRKSGGLNSRRITYTSGND